MKLWFRLLGLVILGIILFRIDLPAVLERLGKTSFVWVLAALCLNIVAIAVKALRWHLMLRAQRISLPLIHSLRYYFGAIFVGLATPGRLGELSRAVWVKSQIGVSGSRALSSVVLDRLLDVYALLAVGSVAIFYFSLASELSVNFLIVGGVIITLPVIFASPRLGRPLLKRLFHRFLGKKFPNEMKGSADDFYDGIEELLGLKLVAGVTLTLVAYGIVFLAAFLLTISLGLEIGYFETALIVGLSNLVALVPITVAGVGTRDAVFVFCFSAIGLEKPEAIGFSVVVFAVFYLGTALLGAPFFFSIRGSATQRRSVT